MSLFLVCIISTSFSFAFSCNLENAFKYKLKSKFWKNIIYVFRRSIPACSASTKQLKCVNIYRLANMCGACCISECHTFLHPQQSILYRASQLRLRSERANVSSREMDNKPVTKWVDVADDVWYLILSLPVDGVPLNHESNILISNF